MNAVEDALLIHIDVVRRVGGRAVMDGAQDDLQPDSEVLVKFLVLGVFSFSVPLKGGWDNFLDKYFAIGLIL